MMHREHASGFDLDAGIDAKDAGIKLVGLNNEEWRDMARAMLLLVANRGIDFTADDVKQETMEQGLEAPKHSAAWGALFAHTAKKGLIEKTGEFRQSRWTANHAHYYPVWRRVRR